MTIAENSLEIRKPERLSGGRMGSSVIIDGQVGNLFSNYGQVSFYAGDIEIKKAYAFVNSAAADLFLKSFLVLTKAPNNSHASAAIFSTKDWFDFTPSHQGYLTSYLEDGVSLQWYVMETARINSPVMTLWAMAGTALPEIGATYVLVGNSGLTTQYEQAVTIQEIQSDEERIFWDVQTQTNFKLRVIQVLMTAVLTNNYTGPQPSRFVPYNTPTQLLSTVYTGSVRVYSVANVTGGTLAAGSYVIPVDSIYTPIVPAQTSATNVIDQTAANQAATLVAAGNPITIPYTQNLAPVVGVYLGMSALPGSIAIATTSGTLLDRAGQLYSGVTPIATIDYVNGIVMPSTSCPAYACRSITFTPAGNTAAPLQSGSISITPANRRQAYTYSLPYRPAAGTVQVWWIAGGKLYKFTDNSDGTLSGISASLGSGEISSLNSIAVTINPIPDAGTSVLFFWGTSAPTFNRGGGEAAPAGFEITTSAAFAKSGLSLSWTVGSTTYTATDDGAGQLTGDATGPVYYSEKFFLYRPNIMVPKGTVLHVTLTPQTAFTDTFNAIDVVSASTFNLTLSHSGIVERSIKLTYSDLDHTTNASVSSELLYNALTFNDNFQPSYINIKETREWVDNGLGGFAGLSGVIINYVSGGLSNLPSRFTNSYPMAVFTQTSINIGQTKLSETVTVGGVVRTNATRWEYNDTTFMFSESGKITVSYLYGDMMAAVTEQHTLSSTVIDLIPQTGEHAVGGSLMMTFQGQKFNEQSGIVYEGVSQAVGTGTVVGTLDYISRRVTLTDWLAGAANAPTINALLTRVGRDSLDELTLRVAAAPLAATSFTLRATLLNGTAITAADDGSGNLSGEYVKGHISLATGIVYARFGKFVTAAGNESQFWYSAENVVGTQVWQPFPVYADTVLYNATTLTRLSLPSDIIGIDTARLPPTGEIEQFRAGDIVYLFHDDSFTVSSPVANASFDCGRLNLDRVWVMDADGARVPTTQYTATAAELDAGILHWAATLDTVTSPTPWNVWHRIADGGTLSNVEVLGYLTLRDRPTGRDFPAGTKVAAMLYVGNIMADWGVPIFGQTWNGVFSNTLVGNASQASYDYLDFPITVTNRGVTVKTRVAIVFESPLLGNTYSTTFKCVIEGIGIVATGHSIADDFAPINPATGVPYFTIAGNNNGHLPWGTGWSAQNFMQFALSPGNFPFEIVRCVQPSAPVMDTDSIRVEFHGSPNE